jgi:molybdenum cofactor synthesis domain-containing protein
LRTSVVDDHLDRIATLVDEALNRADLVLCTGGLGPTVDDVTREAVAHATGRPLEFRQELMDQIAARFAAFNRPMSESNRRQAHVPQGARAIPNARGTAPAFLVEDPRGTVVVLPGVPSEMRFLFETAVLPYLRDERGMRTVMLMRTLHVVGQGESIIGEQIADLMHAANPTIGISAKQARYELRMNAHAESPAAAIALLDQAEATIRARLGELVLGSETLEQQVGRLLQTHNQTLALYEGHLAAPIYRALSADPAALAALRGVTLHPLDEATDESAAAALAHAGALQAQNRWRSSLAIGMQTVAQADEQGFSTICLALTSANGDRTATHRYELHDLEGWQIVGTAALNLLRRHLLELHG